MTLQKARKRAGLDPMQDEPIAVGEPIPAICTIEDVCRVMRISESQFFVLRRQGTFPIPEHLPRLDRRPRFLGENVRKYLAGELAYLAGDLASSRRRKGARE